MPPIISLTQLKATTPFSLFSFPGREFSWLTHLGGFYIQVQPNLPKCKVVILEIFFSSTFSSFLLLMSEAEQA